MRFAQLRDLADELELVRPRGTAPEAAAHERLVHLQESDRLLMLEGLKDTALAVAHAAAPVEQATLDAAAAAQMRRIAKKVVEEGVEALNLEEKHSWDERRPHARAGCVGAGAARRATGEEEAGGARRGRG